MSSSFQCDFVFLGYYKVIEAIIIEIYFDYFYIIPIEIFTSFIILLIGIEPKYLVDFDANSVHKNRNETFTFQILIYGWKFYPIIFKGKDNNFIFLMPKLKFRQEILGIDIYSLT